MEEIKVLEEIIEHSHTMLGEVEKFSYCSQNNNKGNILHTHTIMNLIRVGLRKNT